MSELERPYFIAKIRLAYHSTTYALADSFRFEIYTVEA